MESARVGLRHTRGTHHAVLERAIAVDRNHAAFAFVARTRLRRTAINSLRDRRDRLEPRPRAIFRAGPRPGGLGVGPRRRPRIIKTRSRGAPGTAAIRLLPGRDDVGLARGDEAIGIGRRKRATEANKLALKLVNTGLSRLQVIHWRGQAFLAAVSLVSRNPARDNILQHLVRVLAEDAVLLVGLRLGVGEEARQGLDGDDQLADIGGAGRRHLGQLVLDRGAQGSDQFVLEPVAGSQLVRVEAKQLCGLTAGAFEVISHDRNPSLWLVPWPGQPRPSERGQWLNRAFR